MQRWEYLTLFVQDASWSDSLGRHGELAAARHVGVYTGDPTILLNELGMEGWELSGVAGRDGEGNHRLFFKRPRT